jgi:hypothetical protein
MFLGGSILLLHREEKAAARFIKRTISEMSYMGQRMMCKLARKHMEEQKLYGMARAGKLGPQWFYVGQHVTHPKEQIAEAMHGRTDTRWSAYQGKNPGSSDRQQPAQFPSGANPTAQSVDRNAAFCKQCGSGAHEWKACPAWDHVQCVHSGHQGHCYQACVMLVSMTSQELANRKWAFSKCVCSVNLNMEKP